MKITKVVSLVILVCVLMTLVSVTHAGDEYPKKEFVTLLCKKPIFTEVLGFPWELTKGDVSIDCIPVPFVEKVVYHKTIKEQPKGIISFSSGNTKKYLVTEAPSVYTFTPEKLTFKLHIVNNSSHVVRFTDCPMSLVIDGESVPIDKNTEDKFRKTIILPGNSFDFEIFGPRAQQERVLDEAKTILDTAKTIMFSIYDVTTEVDEANNPAKKETFEWLYENKPASISNKFEKITTEEKLLPSEAQKMNDQWYYK